jgi:2-dehydro-3-deoxygluconokinase
VVAVGEMLGIFVRSGTGPWRAGDAATFSFAGAEGNVAIGLSRLGHRAALLGRVGDDAVGRAILAGLRGEGVDASGVVVDPDAPTAVLVRHHRTADRVRVDYVRRGSAGSRLRPDDLDAAAIAGARALHLTGITFGISPSAREAACAAVRIAREAGVVVSLDVNHRTAVWSRREAAATLRAVLPDVDVLFGGDEELALLAGERDGRGVAEELAALGPAEVVTKRGSRGATALVAGEALREPAVAVTGVDPVGAGDAFVAGYLSARHEGLPPAARLHRAAVCGAFAASSDGDWEGLPHRRELGLLDHGDDVAR